MSELSFSENYMLLLLNATKKHTNIKEAQYSAGIVLGGIYDLLEIGCISMNDGGYLDATGSLPAEYSYLQVLYTGIRHSNKKISKWLEYYCCKQTSKNIRPMINDIYHALSAKGFIDIEVKKGLVKTKTIFHLRPNESAPIIEDFQQGVLNKVTDEKVIFLTQMLSLAEVLKGLFPMRYRMKVKSAISHYKKHRIWNVMKPYVNSIQNYVQNGQYMSAVLAGAFYNGN